MKKFLALMFAATLVVACGKGKEPTKDASEEDDNAPQTSTATASGTAAAPSTAPAATAAAVSPDAATVTGTIKLAQAAPAMPNIQMSADPYCQSQHLTPAKDEEVVVGPAGELANVFVYVKNPSPTTSIPSASFEPRPACRARLSGFESK